MKKIFTLVLVLSSFCAFALNSADFTIQRVTSPYFVVDGNSPTSGPLSAYVGFKITNTSGSVSYSNLKFTIGSIGTSVAGQNFTMVSPANGIALIGTLAPGASKVCYFYVSYPGSTTAQATFNYTLSDATASSKTGNVTVANRSAISANAGGIATQSISSQDLIGGIVSDDVTYTLGNIKSGDENDFQVSVSSQFDPTKLTLLKTEVVSSTVAGITAGTGDLLYFTSTGNQSSGTVTIRWTFKITAFNFTTYVLPYAGSTSGSTNYKYAINTSLGTGTPITVTAAANPLVVSKSSSQALYVYNNTATFTVTIQNPAAYPISVDKITDEIPAGFTYQSLDPSSGVTTANATSYPSNGATGTITFEGGVVSGANTSFIVPANGSLVLKYTATAPSSSASNLLTTANGYIGTTLFGSAQNTVSVSATLPVSIQSFTVSMVNDKVKLDWSTVSEVNSSHFEIERSANSIRFDNIGTMNAKGNSAIINRYSFIDSFPPATKLYYRLRMIDNDGSSKWTNVLSLTNNKQLPSIEIANPFASTLKIGILMPENNEVLVKLVSSNGQVLQKEKRNCVAGMNHFQWNAGNLSRGVYFLQVQTGVTIITKEIVRQ